MRLAHQRDGEGTFLTVKENDFSPSLPVYLGKEDSGTIEPGRWLSGELLFGFLISCSDEFSPVPIDPYISECLKYNRTFRYPGFPIRSGKAVLPYNNSLGNHWILVCYDFDAGTAMIIDSKKNSSPEYTSRLLVEKQIIHTIWCALTDNVFSGFDLKECPYQYDSYNCGVFCAIYGCRIIRGIEPILENSVDSFALSAARLEMKKLLSQRFLIGPEIDNIHPDFFCTLPRAFLAARFSSACCSVPVASARSLSFFLNPLCTAAMSAQKLADKQNLKNKQIALVSRTSNILVPVCQMIRGHKNMGGFAMNKNEHGSFLRLLDSIDDFISCRDNVALLYKKTIFPDTSLLPEQPKIGLVPFFDTTNRTCQIFFLEVFIDDTSRCSAFLLDSSVEAQTALTSEIRLLSKTLKIQSPRITFMKCDNHSSFSDSIAYCFTRIELLFRRLDSLTENILSKYKNSNLLNATPVKSIAREIKQHFSLSDRKKSPQAALGCSSEKTSEVPKSRRAAKRLFVSATDSVPSTLPERFPADSPNSKIFCPAAALPSSPIYTTLPMNSDFEKDTIPIDTNRNTKPHQKPPKKKKVSTLSLYPQQFSLGLMNEKCEHCEAFRFPGKFKSLCCSNGLVQLPSDHFSLTSDPALDWFWELANKDINIFSRTRSINNFVACAGTKIKLKEFANPAGPYPLVIQGKYDVGVCHLEPCLDNRPSFAQIYMASDTAIDNSIKFHFGNDAGFVEYVIFQLIGCLKKINSVVQAYVTMFEMWEEHKKKSDHVRVFMNLKEKRDLPAGLTKNIHAGCLNTPNFENQVAAIYAVENDTDIPSFSFDKGVFVKSRGFRTPIPHFSNSIDCLTHPLIFARGEQTFVKENMPRKSKKQKTRLFDANEDNIICDDSAVPSVSSRFISRRDYTAFLLARRGDFGKHRILGKGKLCSQYIVHCQTRIEDDRLQSIKLNFKELRSTTPSSWYRFLDLKLNEKGVKLGHLITMPGTFVGSRKWYQNLYTRSMAIAQRYGRPDLFITFTGNPEWPEVKQNLISKFDTWVTDPMLCVSVFQGYFEGFQGVVTKDSFFGEVEYFTYSIEFQKRGMPHAHVLLKLKDSLHEKDIDKFICAEIPPLPEPSDPNFSDIVRLRDAVKKFMLHGPCEGRKDLACRTDPDSCSKRFPKEFCPVTTVNQHGIPQYRRRDNGSCVPVGKKQITVARNCDVVPYNPTLLLHFQCHINVEFCSSLKTFKYIFKYIYKGPDTVVVELLSKPEELDKLVVQENGEKILNVDMCEQFRKARYMSQSEAAFRISRFPLQKSSHSVVLLSVHLPDEEPVYFKKNLPENSDFKSPLLAYFDYNKNAPPDKRLSWVQLAESHNYIAGKYKPLKRATKRVARILPVQPKFAELYALRLLLVNDLGATSFDDLLFDGSVVLRTFTEAATRKGLLCSETEWDECLSKAAEIQMPFAMRRLFAQILMYCNPQDPEALWHKYKVEFRDKQTKANDSSVNEELLDKKSADHIVNILTSNNFCVNRFPFLFINIDQNDFANTFTVDDAIRPADSEDVYLKLNSDQKIIVDHIFDALSSTCRYENNCFFIYGKAGCGKTFTLNALIKLCQKKFFEVLPVASTGIAATLLEGGRTAHNAFRLPIKPFSSATSVSADSPYADVLRGVDLIIWDEVTMQNKFNIENADKMLRDICHSSEAFGGKIVVFGGDWCQFLPVVPGGTKSDIIAATLKSSYVWKNMTTFTLAKNMRLKDTEIAHNAWLLSVGEGKMNDGDYGFVDVPRYMLMYQVDEIIDWLYTPETLSDENLLSTVALLTLRNTVCDELNRKVLQKLQSPSYIFESVDDAVSDDLDGFPCDDEEYIHSRTPSGMPPHKLELRIGCVLILLRNLDVSSGLCNGTRLLLKSIVDAGNSSLLMCKNILNGEVCFISRIKMKYENSTDGIAFYRTQFPVRLSFCMTVNKSQGQTFDRLGIIFRQAPFSHGATYVALSRVRDPQNIRFFADTTSMTAQSYTTLNIVYKNIL